jgi:hypothetical protein
LWAIFNVLVERSRYAAKFKTPVNQQYFLYVLNPEYDN